MFDFEIVPKEVLEYIFSFLDFSKMKDGHATGWL